MSTALCARYFILSKINSLWSFNGRIVESKFFSVFIIKENEICVPENMLRSRSKMGALRSEVTSYSLTPAAPFGL